MLHRLTCTTGIRHLQTVKKSSIEETGSAIPAHNITCGGLSLNFAVKCGLVTDTSLSWVQL